MHWTDGDVWKAELEVPVSGDSVTEVQYKYVVLEHDGGVAVWKPGDNYVLQLPLSEPDLKHSLPEKIRIVDAWDSSCRNIEVELRQGPSSEPETQPPEEVAIVAKLTKDAEAALSELKSVVEQSTELLQGVSPISEEALEADRAVAAAAQKASERTRVLNEYKNKGELGEQSADDKP